MPIDVVDFLAKSALLQQDLASIVLLAVLKESAVTDVCFEGYRPASRELIGDWAETAEDHATRLCGELRSRLVRACQEVGRWEVEFSPRASAYHLQVSQLARQGVGRFTGSARVMGALRVTVPTAKNAGNSATPPSATPPGDSPSALPPGDVVKLGNTNVYSIRPYDAGTFLRFCADCVAVRAKWKQFLALEDLDEVVTLLVEIVGEGKFASWFQGKHVRSSTCDVSNFIARKLFLHCWQHGGLRGRID